jgi:phospholipid/cholesterol/gamma-HCH transport system permease protein
MPPLPATAALLEAGPAEGDAAILLLSGRLDAYSVSSLWNEALAALTVRGAVPVVIDASGVEYCDGAGVALLIDLLRQPRSNGKEVRVRNLRSPFDRLFRQFDPKRFTPQPPPPPVLEPFAERIGEVAALVIHEGRERITFLGEAAAAIARTLTGPQHIRWQDGLLIAQRLGADAVPIVTLIGFLIGVILAFQTAVAIRPFGADIYVANAVALAVLRELGPLMTAIILAGRSGSAFAAEIGTMKVNEEIDALITMGLSPVRFLVAPRMIAAFLLCPLLTVVADLMGLIGGAMVMRAFGIPITTFIHQVQSMATQADLFGGLLKAFAFGLLVAGVGCMYGLKTGEGASSVGQSTTHAVVAGIILVVLVDSVFAVIFNILGI